MDPNDDQAFAGWFSVVEASYQHDRPGERNGTVEELQARGRGSKAERFVDVAAIDDGAVVGAARLGLPLLENLRLVGLSQLAVRPDRRRAGIGTALLAEVERLATAAGRDLLEADLDEPGWPEVPDPGRIFAGRHGFECAQVAVRRDLTLPADRERIDTLEVQCRRYVSGYALRTWRDRCPQDLVDDRAVLAARMSTDAPMGDLERAAEHWDADRVRDREGLQLAQNRSWVAVGAIHQASGRMVGFTEVGFPLRAPERGYQWDTLVRREHRGHRLGAWMKVANLRQLADVSPVTTLVTTWNADDNAPMIAVNKSLGCAANGALTHWTKRLGDQR
ncbi:GNAT family N-acetyltransferase [Fodinicola feengrottensis]|uniref:GNAT family N-acetyltransferase n=1 Tax=Fodinicola feengrottensis TaxID=435914 RepID=UPI0024421A05|nr:GNAT family N-acetyltransferase [Fodinicola feengrottensis]